MGRSLSVWSVNRVHEVSDMPLGRQPRRARGTIEHPYSALRLRQVLAIFGMIVCVAGGVLLWALGHAIAGIALFTLAIVAAVDLVIVMIRLR